VFHNLFSLLVLLILLLLYWHYSHVWVFHNSKFLRGEVVSPKPTWRIRDYTSSDPYALTCLAWVVLPGAYAPVSIALRVTRVRKPLLHDNALVYRRNCFYLPTSIPWNNSCRETDNSSYGQGICLRTPEVPCPQEPVTGPYPEPVESSCLVK
jgi:hypothetical protein